MTSLVGGRTCPVCGREGALQSTPGGHDHPLMACQGCGLIRQVDPPTDEELTALYGSDLYAGGSPRAASVVGVMHRAIGRVRMRILPVGPGRLLDVGSGKGHFLDAARRAGWDAVGIEISGAAAEEAARRYGLSTIVDDWAAAEARGPFDAVTFWHVLEHLPDPVAALDKARPLLGPDGVIVVSVPNVGSWQARLFGRSWLHLDLPRHLVHFTPETLSRAMEKAGYRVDHVDTLAPEMEVLGVIQSIQNRLGFEPNFALRFLKRDRTAASAVRGLAALGLAAISLPIALAFVIVAAPLGRGASVQMVGRPVDVKLSGAARAGS